MEGRRLRVADDSVDILFQSDKRLLSRVLRNMVKNALEATTPGETATLGCRLDADRIVLWVHNRTYMPENVRLQIFSRSFSTKGAGRGLGTYSMKFLTEKYLGGELDFTSTEAGGTTFYASYPVALAVHQQELKRA
jgi:signal transduction histidine kinase